MNSSPRQFGASIENFQVVMICKKAMALFEKVIDKLTIVLSNPSAAWKGERGYLTAKHVMGSEKMAPESLIYLSGPEAMVANIQKELLASGVLPQQLVADPFTGYDGA